MQTGNRLLKSVIVAAGYKSIQTLWLH